MVTAPDAPTRLRLTADERRRLIVDAAFKLLASEGFEGLRTRDVAAVVRINSATLHHYFPTKEALIAAVAGRLEERFIAEKAPRVRGEGALTALRQQFADARFYARERPELIAAYRELAARSWRDSTAKALVDGLNRRWQRGLEDIVRQGKAEGVFRPDVTPAAAASAIVAATWGLLALLDLPRAQFDRVCREIERGLLASPGRKP